MRDYGKVHTAFWTSDDLRALDGDGRLLALYLLTGPHTTQIGCFRVPDGYVMEDLGWEMRRVQEAFRALCGSGFAIRDDASKWVLLPKFLKWNAIENPNQGKAAKKLFDQVPLNSGLKTALAEAIKEHVNAQYLAVEAPVQQPIEPTVGKGLANPSETVQQTVSKPGTGTGTGTVLSRGGAAAPPVLQLIPDEPVVSTDPKTELYRRGKEVLKSRDAGGLITKLLAAHGGNVPLARASIETASTKTDPKEYLGGLLRARERQSDAEQLRQRGEAW